MSTVAKKVLMGSGAVAEPLEIDQSLIFDETRGSFLGRASSAISAGNQRTFTFSTWVKLCSKPAVANNTHFMMARPTAGGGPLFSIMVLGTEKQLYIFEKNNSSVTRWALQCSAVLRDPAAWYHIVVAIDTTQAANANKVKPYINGVLQTSFVTAGYPDQNDQMPWNGGAVPQYLGWNVGSSGDFYMAETHSIDGAAKAASDFGKTNDDTGQWIPKKYSGSYGTNGFYLKFVSGALGTDSSGESNNYTATNLANADVVTDSPTNNFATLNPLFTASVNNTYSEGNLKTVCPNSTKGLCVATIVPTAGKYYAEFKTTAGFADYPMVGVFDVSSATTTSSTVSTVSTKNIGYYAYNGQILAGPSGAVLDTVASWAVNDIIAVAIDYDNSTVKWYKNNTLVFTKSSADLKDVTFAFSGTSGSSGYTIEANFGQKTLAYTPPSGYVALSTANLPDPAIPLSSAHFNTVLYTGAGQTQTVTGVGFQPDWLWIKSRSAVSYHNLMDAVRGIGSTTKVLFSNSTDAEASLGSGTNKVSAVNSNGFVIDGNSTDLNASSGNYVAWNWKANGSGSTDTSGDIDAVVSANQAAGFSIITFTGDNSANGTVPHGLGVVPDFVWYKSRVGSSWENWVHSSIISGNKRLLLQSTAAASSINTNYLLGGEIATSTMISNNAHTTSQPIVAYCFASKPGFSKVGTYTGNGSATAGPFVNTGFKPAWVMYKRTDAVNDWLLFDNKRDVDNVASLRLFPNQNYADYTDARIDILSNGFKVRATTNDTNANGGTYLYLAFAESPQKTATAR